MKTHHLKTNPLPFQAVRAGIKGFEFRKDDRDYQVGDVLVLQEWDTFDFQTGRYSGEEEEVSVTYKLSGPAYGIPLGYCIMSIQKFMPEIMKQKTITIPEGSHQPRGLNLPRPAIFTRSMSLKVKFLPESLYKLEPGQTNHLNKLFGWSMGYHRHCSLRMAWRPHPDSDQVEIFAYPYQRGKNMVQESLIDGEHDGIHNPFFLGLANMEKWYPLSIWLSHKKWMFQNGTRLVSIPGPGPGIGYKLDDFFGGDPPAPQPITYLISK